MCPDYHVGKGQALRGVSLVAVSVPLTMGSKTMVIALFEVVTWVETVLIPGDGFFILEEVEFVDYEFVGYVII